METIKDLDNRYGSDRLAQKQRELIDELRADFGYSEEEARKRLRLAGG